MTEGDEKYKLGELTADMAAAATYGGASQTVATGSSPSFIMVELV